jgi:hypothetical protein
MRAEVFQRGALGWRDPQKGASDLREQDLASVCDSGDTCSPMDVETHWANGGVECLSCVDAHAHANVLSIGPLVVGERALDRDRRGGAGGCRVEHCKKRIALRSDLDSAVLGEGRSDDPMMLDEDLGVSLRTEADQERRRTLDVREEECHRPRGPTHDGNSAVPARVARLLRYTERTCQFDQLSSATTFDRDHLVQRSAVAQRSPPLSAHRSSTWMVTPTI